MYMEDIQSITSDILDILESKLKDNSLELDMKQEDAIYALILETLDKVAGYPDYRNYN